MMIQMHKPKSYKVKPVVGSHGEPISCTPLPDHAEELREIAARIANGSDNESWPAPAMVDYFCDVFDVELPRWFQNAHRQVLVSMILEEGKRC